MAPDTATREGGEVASGGLLGRLLQLFPYGAGLFLVLALLAEHDHISRQNSHFGRMLLAGFAVLLVHLTRRLRELDDGLGLDMRTRSGGLRRVGARVLLTVWAAAAATGVVNYYQFNAKVASTVDDYADATYYYLNSKYFDELGYTKLYRAMLVADAEGPGDLKRVRGFRDLVDYEKILPRRVALSDPELAREGFSDARWDRFKSDLAYITGHHPHGGWRYFFIDHGYNPPPPWTLVGGTLSQWVPVDHMKIATSVDMVLVALMMLGIAWVASPAAMCVALVFFCSTFSGRWPILGHAILRFDWLCALVGAALSLRRGRHGWAGAMLTYATCVRVFPGIFAMPYVVALVRDTLRERRLLPHYRHFIVGAAVTGVLMIGGSLARYGSEAYAEAFTNLRLHSSPESFSSHRVGLGDVLMYRGEWSAADLRAAGSAPAKRDELWKLNPTLQLIGLLSIALVAAYVFRSREPHHRLLWLGIYPLFAMTNPQINYYNLRLLLVLLHTERWDEYRHRIGLYMLFAIEVVTQGAQVAGAARYGVTAMTSLGMAGYLAVMLGFLVYDYVVAGRSGDADDTDADAKSADVNDADARSADVGETGETGVEAGATETAAAQS